MKKPILSLLAGLAFISIALCGCNCKSIFQGEFYTLQEAYDAGFITQEDLENIAYYHNGGTEGNEEIMGADFQPKPKTPEVLDKTTELSIRQTYWDEYFNKDPQGSTLNDISVDYYWTCENCVAIKIWCSGCAYTNEYWKDTIGGVQFIYTCGNEIKIWIEK